MKNGSYDENAENCIRSFISWTKRFFHERVKTAVDLKSPILKIIIEIDHVGDALFRLNIFFLF